MNKRVPNCTQQQLLITIISTGIIKIRRFSPPRNIRQPLINRVDVY